MVFETTAYAIPPLRLSVQYYTVKVRHCPVAGRGMDIASSSWRMALE